MGTTVELSSIQEIIFKQGLQKKGKIQKLLTSEVARLSDPYVPFRTGTLKSSTRTIHPDKVIYHAPYARYQYYGKVMVGPPPKTVTDIDLTYNGSPMRGAFWAKRMWKDRGKEIIKTLQRMVKR